MAIFIEVEFQLVENSVVSQSVGSFEEVAGDTFTEEQTKKGIYENKATSSRHWHSIDVNCEVETKP